MNVLSLIRLVMSGVSLMSLLLLVMLGYEYETVGHGLMPELAFGLGAAVLAAWLYVLRED